MDNKDYIVRASLANDSVRAFAISSTHLVAEARERHRTLPVVTAALGRLLSAGAIMGSMMKGDKDIVTISLKGDGPAGYITVTADSHGHVKGFPGNPNVDIPRKYAGKLDVGTAVGRGLLTVSYDLGLKEPYSGQVEIQTGEVAEDLAYYFTVSEQLPSAVGLGVMVDTDSSVKHAGGFIVQLLPDAPEDVIELLEKKLANLEPVTTMMEQGMTPEEMLLHIFEGVDIEFTERHDVKFYCDCSKEKVKRALAAISDKDLQDIVNDDEDIEVKCFFCNTAYKFSIADIKDILSSRKID
ncbi:MAG: Hsp33 family molecular chaperone HslO [Mogibacterium diversum]|jgi:hsp33 protein|uniref:33 kDa chaperonin n=1 Tax=Mogibacterium diversum TaxID=114527 RepID=A0A2S0L430_9FIRM|nr:Hsp33 family molecular chaperone HslO [Mogibacterium diversum]MBB1547482.1 Hsp33 family molecular chaperone HslO [Mogibacterium sp.]AVM48025.1 Hsp33 family molecular chaperone HslO [Mogibacterium diversum]MBF1319599.1 Hsp33 family molecular chaperone HslO [Mogibacterium diversum]MBF1341079.1 Hsp33 family molecular chaperone HslO [Mogibacterium diversum]MBF1358072.1 Hsp33 family molecular chaperone HslO [Mogibacterium diversum]